MYLLHNGDVANRQSNMKSVVAKLAEEFKHVALRLEITAELVKPVIGIAHFSPSSDV